MTQEFVNYNQASALKELGFNEPCLMYIDDEGDLINDDTAEWFGAIDVPLKQQVFRWFRDKHNIDSHIEKYLSSEDAIEYFFMISDEKSIDFESINFESHKEAESACINKLIEILKKEIV